MEEFCPDCAACPDQILPNEGFGNIVDGGFHIGPVIERDVSGEVKQFLLYFSDRDEGG